MPAENDRTVKLLLAAILAALVVIVGVLVVQGREDHWSSQECIKASLSGSGYTRTDMEDHGCFD